MTRLYTTYELMKRQCLCEILDFRVAFVAVDLFLHKYFILRQSQTVIIAKEGKNDQQSWLSPSFFPPTFFSFSPSKILFSLQNR